MLYGHMIIIIIYVRVHGARNFIEKQQYYMHMYPFMLQCMMCDLWWFFVSIVQKQIFFHALSLSLFLFISLNICQEFSFPHAQGVQTLENEEYKKEQCFIQHMLFSYSWAFFRITNQIFIAFMAKRATMRNDDRKEKLGCMYDLLSICFIHTHR